MAQSPIVFLKEVRSELGKVSWPTRKEAIRLTAVVIFVSLAVGIFIGAMDYIFAKGMALLFRK
ncbi:preprotein translocase subunit SecE [Candidatus Shapirobacteria bacterium CG10_big_fil_rev_8_21_14_0_10_40_9]|uniref:Protein translocase subunit SecE n=1 Tax=Candidatus Shapirobacteria bacterium CG10_big_fil_rev_8_21_14_0_10_40_9 TaxID=1974888 RepID=A0A2M8L3W1_9BACT|nr:MAG: preprotein translocase subunit SecE [Candidatus Shapirobacteria bacterium CG10_big_fil_rev_8_21_14_0_10_40_9]